MYTNTQMYKYINTNTQIHFGGGRLRILSMQLFKMQSTSLIHLAENQYPPPPMQFEEKPMKLSHGELRRNL